MFNVLLQILDDGRITDAQGHRVDFRNTVIIMTSNIGSQYLLDGVDANGQIRPEAEARVMAELRGHFRPEFLNRIDDIVLFRPLALPQIERIVGLQFEELRHRLAERQISLELAEAGRRLIAEKGFDPVFGARPLRRYISHEVETQVGRALIRGEVSEGGVVRIDAHDGELVVNYEKAPAATASPPELVVRLVRLWGARRLSRSDLADWLVGCASPKRFGCWHTGSTAHKPLTWSNGFALSGSGENRGSVCAGSGHRCPWSYIAGLPERTPPSRGPGAAGVWDVYGSLGGQCRF